MTDSAADFIAVALGIGVFLVIVAVGWRSVQKRRILRLQGARGQETIIVAREGDEISSIVTTTTTDTKPAVAAANTDVAEAATTPEFGRSAAKGPSAV